jgi:hypothetical protein
MRQSTLAHLAFQIPCQHLLGALSTERASANKQYVEQHPNAEAIHFATILLIPQNLWCDVSRRTASHGHRLFVPFWRGQTKIHKLHFVGIIFNKDDILSLDVSVHDTALV